MGMRGCTRTSCEVGAAKELLHELLNYLLGLLAVVVVVFVDDRRCSGKSQRKPNFKVIVQGILPGLWVTL